jgi:hypothetical protein
MGVRMNDDTQVWLFDLLPMNISISEECHMGKSHHDTPDTCSGCQQPHNMKIFNS